MPTTYQKLMDRSAAFLDAADAGSVGQVANGTVQLSVAPGVDVDANVGQFTEERYMESTAYQWIEYGTITIRHSALASRGITARPAAGQEIEARGKKYRIKHSAPDSTGYTLNCVNIY